VLCEWPEWIDVLRLNLGSKRRKERGAGWNAWCFDTNAVYLYWLRGICRLWQPLFITFCEIYYPSDEEKEDAQLYADNETQINILVS